MAWQRLTKSHNLGSTTCEYMYKSKVFRSNAHNRAYMNKQTIMANATYMTWQNYTWQIICKILFTDLNMLYHDKQ